MIKKHTAHYKGMSKDLASDLQSEHYFDAKNIRILATDQKSSFAVTNEAGNELVFEIPAPVVNSIDTNIEYDVNGKTKTLSYTRNTSIIPGCELEESFWNYDNSEMNNSGTQIIIGVKELRDSAIIISTDNNGFNCFWELESLNDGDFDLTLLYIADLGLSSDNLVQILYNYENSIIQKIYFVDGEHQLRFFNIRQSIDNGDSINLVDLSPSVIDVVGTFVTSQPYISSVISGGGHTSGMIQYAFGLYILNGAQTTVSPLSNLVPIDKGDGLGGGEVNEVLGKSVQVEISDIDSKFTHVRLYSIKYTSYNQDPEIKIVADKEIDNFDTLSITDDGTSSESVSLEEFLFLGTDPIIPQHITTKDNRLFPINITKKSFDIDLDCRAFAFSTEGSCVVLDSTFVDDTGNVAGSSNTVVAGTWGLSNSHDSINADYNTYAYQSDGSTLGASGQYVNVEVVQSSLSDSEAEDLQFLKDRELYRIGIEFYNRRGQTSLPNWVMDLRAPEGNLEGNYNQLKVSLTADFYTWLNTSSNFDEEDDKPVGYKILRADRTLNDQTIYAQGMINPMIANYVSNSKKTSRNDRKEAVNGTEADIMPSMTRMFETMYPFVECIDYHCLAWNDADDSSRDDLGRGRSYESYKASASSDWRAQNFQHNRLMQFFSPEVLFRNNQIDASFNLNVVGLMEQSDVANWSTETNPITSVISVETKFLNGITSATTGVNPLVTSGSASDLSDMGFFGPTNSDHDHATHQVYREFLGDFHKNTGTKLQDVYGAPELTDTGADFTAYNNDYSLRYCNNLKTMLIDRFKDSDHVNDDADCAIKGVNTNGSKCITFAEGPDNTDYDVSLRKSIEEIYAETGISETKGVLLAEFVKDETLLYTGGVYGGFSNESKSNSTYIEIGEYTDINTDFVTIDSPGDTFVNTFTFTKMVKDDTEIQDQDYNLVCEIVSIRLETTVDLKNRSDLSLDTWDNRRQPKYDEYQKYNTVYSQQPNLATSTDVGTKFKKIEEFDGRIMSSGEKIPGEYIDSWTDFLENETMDLDGKYGPINAVVNLKDEIFCLQDTGVAHIAINPRSQVVGDDGISVELGTGGILHDYSYKSTTVGALSKWGVVTSENAFYFIDLINRGIMTFDGSRVGRLSDSKGFHHELLNRMVYNELNVNNAVLGTGVSAGYNPVNADVYFSFHQSSDSFTIGFNEKLGEFISYYEYVPAWYINKGNVLISSNPDNTQLWEHFKGTPNHFYGTHYPSRITLQVAPEGDEIILNGATYKLEATDNDGNDLPLVGLTRVRAYNEYQDSGEVSLIMRTNVWKKFRNWKINLPREAGGRERVRSAFGFAEFIIDNEDGNKIILHDITIFYTQH